MIDEHEPSSDGDSAARKQEEAEEQAQRMAARALGRARSRGHARQRSSGSGQQPSKRSPQKGSRSTDPQEVGAVLESFLGEQGWDAPAAIARLGDNWAEIVGPEVAEHVQVESVEAGVLRLSADSTAWATQLRLLSSTIVEQVQRALGADLVSEVQVRGPQAPSWKAGPRVVKGRGPRDTYG